MKKAAERVQQSVVDHVWIYKPHQACWWGKTFQTPPLQLETACLGRCCESVVGGLWVIFQMAVVNRYTVERYLKLLLGCRVPIHSSCCIHIISLFVILISLLWVCIHLLQIKVSFRLYWGKLFKEDVWISNYHDVWNSNDRNKFQIQSNLKSKYYMLWKFGEEMGFF